jgi:hypothetical protein
MSVLDLMAKTAAANSRLAGFVCEIASDNAFAPQLQKMATTTDIELSVVRRWLTDTSLSEPDREKLEQIATILERTRKRLTQVLARILV